MLKDCSSIQVNECKPAQQMDSFIIDNPLIEEIEQQLKALEESSLKENCMKENRLKKSVSSRFINKNSPNNKKDLKPQLKNKNIIIKPSSKVAKLIKGERRYKPEMVKWEDSQDILKHLRTVGKLNMEITKWQIVFILQ